MAVNFYLDNRTNKSGDAPIRISITIKGARFITSTGQKIAHGKWDAARQRVRKGCSNGAGITYNVINGVLSQMIDYLTGIEGDYISGSKTPTADDIKKAFVAKFGTGRKARTAQPKGATALTMTSEFFLRYDEFIKEESTEKQWTLSTVRKFNSLKTHVYKFRSSLTFDDLTEKKLRDFARFLQEEQRLRNSSIKKILSLLWWYLRWATRKGYNANTAYQNFSQKFKTVEKKIYFLEWDELMRVYSFEIPKSGTVMTIKDADGREYQKEVLSASALTKTRDMFCFCAFTSLRYSDLQNLKWADIGQRTFTITTVKTADTITIDLNKYARSILDKYRNFSECNGYVFPRMTNQRMNTYLKELCELCEINNHVTSTYYRGPDRIDETRPKYEYISTHAGRRTFICNALMLGIPPQVVMKWTGHSDYKAMKPYIDITETAKALAMMKFDEI